MRLTLAALTPFPEVGAGDDLAETLLEALAASGERLADGDVVAIAQKVVSKAEGRLVRLAEVEPGVAARDWAARTGKDPRLVELILRESCDVLRWRTNLMIVEHRLGHVCANAGIDQSNVDHAGGEVALLLPEDPDASAMRLKDALERVSGARIGVLVTDSVGRAWRVGTVTIAIGCAGLPAVDDLRGSPDRFGRAMRVSIVGHADQIASAAGIAMGEGAEGTPAVLVRGLAPAGRSLPASTLNRALAEDMFR